MANVMTKRGSLDNVVTFEHYCDTLADLQKIPKDQISLGSVAIVLQGQNNELEVYMATTGKQWVPLLESGGSDESGGVYDLLHICAQNEYDSITLIPTVEEPNDTTIYLVPGGSGNDLYQEWIYVDDEWEKFGVGTMEIPDAVIKTDIAPIEATTTSTAAHAIGEMFWLNGTLYKATSAIAVGGTITVGTNCEAVVIGDELVARVMDVQVNGTSIISSGVANVPIAGNNDGIPGVVMLNGQYGVQKGTNDYLRINGATETEIKTGTNNYKPIIPAQTSAATFYGLAKAAGDSTQAASSNAVGTYTNEAKSAIRNMLGVETTTMFVEEVSGTAVTITGEPNTRYICGEVLTISITPPVTGTIDVIFTSGSTLAVLTLPNTVKMPEWWTGVETGYIYEIVITDGVYGSVMAWPT